MRTMDRLRLPCLALLFGVLPQAFAGPLPAPTPVTLLPPQSMAVDLSTWAVAVGDLDGDGFDDIVTLSQFPDDPAAMAFKPAANLTVNVYLNEGKVRRAGDTVQFHAPMSIATLKADPAGVYGPTYRRGQMAGSLQIVDIDGDGRADLLITNPEMGTVMILWNQGTNARALFEYVANNAAPDKSLTLTPALSTYGAPVYAAALDVDGDGQKDLVIYHAGVTPPETKDPSGKPELLQSRSYEAFSVMLGIPGKPRQFDQDVQQRAWPGCDLALGGANCGVLPDFMIAGSHLFDHRIGQGACQALGGVNCFYNAASDVLSTDSALYNDAVKSWLYNPASVITDASARLRVLPHSLSRRDGQGAVDSFWFEGQGNTHQLAFDTLEKLIYRRTSVPTVEGKQRSGSADFGALSDGRTVLLTAGGFKACYDVVDQFTPDCRTSAIPEYFNRPYQLGAFVRWMALGEGTQGGPALLSLSDYYQSRDPGSKEAWWSHAKLDGSGFPPVNWGAPALLMWEFAQEDTGPDGKLAFRPFFQLDSDSTRFGAVSITNDYGRYKPQVNDGHFGSKTEHSLLVLTRDAFTGFDGKARLDLYRPDDGSYVSPVPHLDGLFVGKFIKDGFPASINTTLPAGEKSVVLVGTGLGAPDPARYAVVKDKTTRAIQGVFPVGQTEQVKGLSKQGLVVSGLSALAVGKYTLELHNAKAIASLDINVVNPFGIVGTDRDWSAGAMCGLVPDTKTGDLWPKQIAVTVKDFPGADQLQAVRWIKSDGTAIDLPALGHASYDAATHIVTLLIPQDGRMTDGAWTPYIQAGNQWQVVPHVWNVTHDGATLAACAHQTTLVNEEAYAQCDDTHLFLDTVQYQRWPNIVDAGTMRLFGQGFVQYHIQSAALKQGDTRLFTVALEVVDDSEVHLYFGDLKDKLTDGIPVDLYLYSEPADVVQANGVPASGAKLSWRTAMKGTCLPQAPQITEVSSGSGPDGAFQTGDTIKVRGKNLIFPVPSANVYVLQAADGTLYGLTDPRLPDDWATHHYDNEDATLWFTVPEDLTPYTLKKPVKKALSGETDITPDVAALHVTSPVALVAAGQTALATTAVSEYALAAWQLAPAQVKLALMGVGVTGMSSGKLNLAL